MERKSVCKGVKLVVGLLLLLGLVACSNNTSGNDVVAVVNGREITLQEIRQEIREREVSLQMSRRVQQLSGEDEENNSFNPQDYIEQYIRNIGLDPSSLTEDEKRYFRRMRRSMAPLDENQAFNLLLRREVLYQEAKRQGFDVSLEEARKLLEEVDEMSEKSYKREGSWEKVLELEKEAWQALGYRSREEWKESRIPRIARSVAIKRLKENFASKLGERYPEVRGFEFEVLRENAWEDYTEKLIRRANIKIKRDGFEITFYGKE
ncbi:hypothetical protein [Calderihabitans maritimus]|uniref:Uncharacterized protein n=1 Tax=Calderihabitans maritimus TaxID=1246530 RepID=A0A1Z5HPD6_9FIRM|nr:hypothetical protein [Calderihabitans maritimus]GAW91374.1 hypothetical protein Moth_1019 [Calderihabitans maritimus]